MMEWISVKDKSPEQIQDLCEYNFVFVCGKESINAYPLIAIAQMVNREWQVLENTGAYGDVGEVEFKSEYITHWCLPELP